jgi:hypothetical protein
MRARTSAMYGSFDQIPFLKDHLLRILIDVQLNFGFSSFIELIHIKGDTPIEVGGVSGDFRVCKILKHTLATTLTQGFAQGGSIH